MRDGGGGHWLVRMEWRPAGLEWHSRFVRVSASVNLPLHHKVQKFSSGIGSPGWSRKKGHKTVVVVVWTYISIVELMCSWELTVCVSFTLMYYCQHSWMQPVSSEWESSLTQKISVTFCLVHAQQEQQIRMDRFAIFTARHSYPSAVLEVVILSIRPSVCPSVCLSHACFVTNPGNYRRYFYTTWKGNPSSFCHPTVVGGDVPFNL